MKTKLELVDNVATVVNHKYIPFKPTSTTPTHIYHDKLWKTFLPHKVDPPFMRVIGVVDNPCK